MYTYNIIHPGLLTFQLWMLPVKCKIVFFNRVEFFFNLREYECKAKFWILYAFLPKISNWNIFWKASIMCAIKSCFSCRSEHNDLWFIKNRNNVLQLIQRNPNIHWSMHVYHHRCMVWFAKVGWHNRFKRICNFLIKALLLQWQNIRWLMISSQSNTLATYIMKRYFPEVLKGCIFLRF